MKVTEEKLKTYEKLARTIAEQSPDSQTKVGSIIIHSKTGAVLGSGFNGFVRGGPDQSLPTSRPEKYDYIIHAETNLLYNCARHGVSTDECFVYCTLSPCINCLRALYQSGIEYVFFKDTYRDFDKNTTMKDLHLKLSEVGEFVALKIEPRQL